MTEKPTPDNYLITSGEMSIAKPPSTITTNWHNWIDMQSTLAFTISDGFLSLEFKYTTEAVQKIQQNNYLVLYLVFQGLITLNTTFSPKIFEGKAQNKTLF